MVSFSVKLSREKDLHELNILTNVALYSIEIFSNMYMFFHSPIIIQLVFFLNYALFYPFIQNMLVKYLLCACSRKDFKDCL